MKRILLGCLIIFVGMMIIMDIRDYVLGNHLTSVDSSFAEGEYTDFTDASNEIESLLQDKLGSSEQYASPLYKLPDQHYLRLEMHGGDYRRSHYLLTGFIEEQDDSMVKLSFPDKDFHLIRVGDQFQQKSWDIESKAGTHHLSSGVFSDSDRLEDRLITNDEDTAGLQLSTTLKKGVIWINEQGIWLDRGNNKIGMNEEMKSYQSERAAVKAVKKEGFGKLSGVLKTPDMHFYIFSRQVNIFNEYTVLPVRIKGQEFIAGPFEKFTFEDDSGVNSDVEEKVGSIIYKLHFQQNAEKLRKYPHHLQVDDMDIAVEVGGGH